MTSLITVDLDSTLCDTGHRHHMINREGVTDWKAYSNACENDGLVIATAQMVRLFADAGHLIHYVSGRANTARENTLKWLAKHDLPCDGLWMDDSPDEDHVLVFGSHAAYKFQRIKDVSTAVGLPVSLHIDDYSSVKVVLEDNDVPCLCVRTPQEVIEQTQTGAFLA